MQPSNPVITTAKLRATELDTAWAKGYSRLAEVYVAQDRLQLALGAYTKAMNLSSGNQKKTYKASHDKIKERLSDTTFAKKNIYNAKTTSGGMIFDRLKAAIPSNKPYDYLDPSPLGYLTAADKVCEAYTTCF
jgi:hypothetical protein